MHGALPQFADEPALIGTPRTNGKAERFIQTVLRERLCPPFSSSQDRADALHSLTTSRRFS